MNEVGNALGAFVEGFMGDGIFPVQVTALNQQDFTFDCVDGENNLIYDVRTNAVPGRDGFFVLPQVGSSALICRISIKDQDYVLIHAERISELRIYISDTTSILVSGQEVIIGRGEEPAVLGNQLNSNLDDLIVRIDALLQSFEAYANTQASASAGTLAPLAPGYTALLSALSLARGQFSTVRADLPNHLSQVISIT